MITSALRSDARGRWKGILATLGVPAKLLDGQHQACPFCGGKDRFKFTDFKSEGWYICNQCGSGDGFALAHEVLHISYPELGRRVAELLGSNPPAKVETMEEKINKQTLKLWNEAKPLGRASASNPICLYLKRRGLRMASRQLRLHDRIYESESKLEFQTMVAGIHNPVGRLAGIHLTFLEVLYGKWQKANIKSPRKIRRVEGTISGGSVRLYPITDGHLGLAEGIETAHAVRELHELSCWAVISTSGMKNWKVPEDAEIKRVSIFADRDDNFAGQRAAYELANRLVIKDGLAVEVFVPKTLGDYLDVLNRVRRERK